MTEKGIPLKQTLNNQVNIYVLSGLIIKVMKDA